MNIEQFVKDQQASRATKGLCVHYTRSIDGKPSVYAASTEADKQAFIAKLKVQGREILNGAA